MAGFPPLLRHHTKREVNIDFNQHGFDGGKHAYVTCKDALMANEKQYNEYQDKVLSMGLITVQSAVAKCICECNQSRLRVVFYPEPVAMSSALCAWSLFCRVSPLSLFAARARFQQPCVIEYLDGLKVIPWMLTRIPIRNRGSSHRRKLCRLIQSWRALFCITA